MVSKIGIFSVGTGGHIVPSVRIVDELIQKGILKEEILVVTGKRNEKKFYKNYDIDVLEHDFIRSEGGIFYYIFNVCCGFYILIKTNILEYWINMELIY